MTLNILMGATTASGVNYAGSQRTSGERPKIEDLVRDVVTTARNALDRGDDERKAGILLVGGGKYRGRFLRALENAGLGDVFSSRDNRPKNFLLYEIDLTPYLASYGISQSRRDRKS